jgi:hypothetical protein
MASQSSFFFKLSNCSYLRRFDRNESSTIEVTVRLNKEDEETSQLSCGVAILTTDARSSMRGETIPNTSRLHLDEFNDLVRLLWQNVSLKGVEPFQKEYFGCNLLI